MIVVAMNAGCDTQEEATKVMELFSRVMAGLAFEGTFVSVSMQKIEDTAPVGSEENERPS